MLLLTLAPAILGGCQTDGTTAAASAEDAPVGEITSPVDLAPVPPPVESFHRGLYYFHRADYGLAEQCFRETVEKTPNNTGAWIALAASYDNLRRFAFADRAYATAIRLAGETPQILNNQALSYMLRGDLPRAHAKLVKAIRLDPHSLVVRRNLQIVDARIADRRHPAWTEEEPAATRQ